MSAAQSSRITSTVHQECAADPFGLDARVRWWSNEVDTWGKAVTDWSDRVDALSAKLENRHG